MPKHSRSKKLTKAAPKSIERDSVKIRRYKGIINKVITVNTPKESPRSFKKSTKAVKHWHLIDKDAVIIFNAAGRRIVPAKKGTRIGGPKKAKHDK